MLKNFYLLYCLLLLSSGLAMGQEAETRIVSGVLRSPDGEILPGATIRIKGTDRGVVTDGDGKYRIEAREGDILVFTMIGYTSFEVTVTGNNSTSLNKLKQKPKTQSKQKAAKNLPSGEHPTNERGVAILTDSTSSFVLKDSNSYHSTRIFEAVAKIKNRDGQLLIVPSWYRQRYAPTFGLEFTTAWSMHSPNRLPELQSEYAQSDAVEIDGKTTEPTPVNLYSWGPAIRNLEYNEQGLLVPAGEGVSPARTYDPYRIFRTGYSTDNRLLLYSEVNGFDFKAGYGNKYKSGILPGNDFKRHTFDLSVKKNFYPLEPRLYFTYSSMQEDLPLKGANMASVLSSIYRTPPSFDILHGMDARTAWKSAQQWSSATAREHSFAPEFIDHPYWLLQTMPDHKDVQKLVSGLDLRARDLYPFDIRYNLLMTHEKDQEIFGLAPGSRGAPQGRLTDRNLSTTTLTSSLTPKIGIDLYDSPLDIDLFTSYIFNYQQQNLQRVDGFEFTDLSSFDLAHAGWKLERMLSPFRRTHEVLTKANFYWSSNYRRIVELSLSNQLYLSNTLTEDLQEYWLPSVSLNINWDDIDQLRNRRSISRLRTYTSFARTVQEAPLLYNQWHFNSLNRRQKWYIRDYILEEYFEAEELAHHINLLPEEQHKYELGADLWMWNDRFNINLNYYYTITDQLIVPVYNGWGRQLKNIARVSTPGIDLSLKTRGDFTGGNWNLSFNFSRQRPLVTELYEGKERVPIAGIYDISTNLIVGEPYGVLYGSRFKRDQYGRMLIGSDGYPLVDYEGGVIGNPNPDWLAGLYGAAEWKNIGFSFQLDVKKGGDVWNGTRQYLNHYGTSAQSAEQRNIRNYIFEGVTEDGVPNYKEVDFYTPGASHSQQRWTRYGETGVAEEAIEDASALRLHELRLSYNLTTLASRLGRFNKVQLSFIGKNLLLISRYNGIDPATNLFGYQHGIGLDLFNQPNMKSYGFALTLKL